MKYLLNAVTLSLRKELCTRCGRCLEVCPHGVFVLGAESAEITDRDLCIECGACARNCPEAALAVRAGVGCAAAVIYGMLAGGEPSCGLAGPAADPSEAGGSPCCGAADEPGCGAADEPGCGCDPSSGGRC